MPADLVTRRCRLCRVKAGLLTYATRAWAGDHDGAAAMREYVMPVVHAYGHTVEIYASVWDTGEPGARAVPPTAIPSPVL